MWPLLGCGLCLCAHSLDLSQLTNQDAARGIRAALNTGASAAIGKLGVPGGFFNNPEVKIPLPPAVLWVASPMAGIAIRPRASIGQKETPARSAEFSVACNCAWLSIPLS